MSNDGSNQINSSMNSVGALKTNPAMGNYLRSYWVAFVTTLSVALCLTLVSRGFGQTVQANQADLARNRAELASAPNAYPGGVVEGHAVPSPNDPDLGEQAILKRAEGYQPFTASVAAPFYWTSNVALVKTGEQSDFLVAPVAALAYQPRITNALYGLVSVREQLFYYDRFSNLNFGTFDVVAGLAYTLPQFHNLTLSGQYVYERLTTKNSFHEFFSNHSLVLTAELPIRLGRAQQFSLGADANISFAAEPDPPQRSDYEIYLGYTVRLSRSFSLDAVGRVVLRDYHLTDRLDVSEILAVAANYSITKFLTASAISTLAASQSNHSVFDYQVANVGGLVSLSIRF
jgi:hypothetical protein